MTAYSKPIKVMKVLNGTIWFILGVALTVIVYPALTRGYPSEIVSVSFTNQTTQSMECIVSLPNGHGFTTVVDPGGQSSLIIHEGEFVDRDFPESMRTIIIDESGVVVYNDEQSIEARGTEYIFRPSSFEITQAENGEIVVTMSRLQIGEEINP